MAADDDDEEGELYDTDVDGSKPGTSNPASLMPKKPDEEDDPGSLYKTPD